MNSPQSFRRIVTKYDRLRQLTAQARRLAELERELRACLPADLARHVRLATIRDGCLVLQADSAAWGSQLRFKAPQIIRALGGRPGFEEIRSIRVRNAPREVTAMAQPAPRRTRLSEAGARSIRAQADTMEDGALRDALRRLARPR